SACPESPCPSSTMDGATRFERGGCWFKSNLGCSVKGRDAGFNLSMAADTNQYALLKFGDGQRLAPRLTDVEHLLARVDVVEIQCRGAFVIAAELATAALHPDGFRLQLSLSPHRVALATLDAPGVELCLASRIEGL